MRRIRIDQPPTATTTVAFHDVPSAPAGFGMLSNS
jgi:hypothetical protein